MAETVTEMIEQNVDVTTTLSELEELALRKHEKTISKGLNTFLEVGHALAEIRDRRLYRGAYKTFEKYCKDVWDLSKGYAYQQIGGYETVKLLESKMSAIADKNENPTEESIGTDPDPQEIVLPINEAQARAIGKLKRPDDQVKAWGIVLDKLNQNPKTKLTAALINKAVREIQGKKVKKTVEATKKEVTATNLVSNQFSNQYQVLLDIVNQARNNGWADCKQAEVVRYLKALVKVAESDD